MANYNLTFNLNSLPAGVSKKYTYTLAEGNFERNCVKLTLEMPAGNHHYDGVEIELVHFPSSNGVLVYVSAWRWFGEKVHCSTVSFDTVKEAWKFFKKIANLVIGGDVA